MNSTSVQKHVSAETMAPAGGIGHLLLLSTVAAIGGFLFGFDSGVINGTVDALRVSLRAGTTSSKRVRMEFLQMPENGT